MPTNNNSSIASTSCLDEFAISHFSVSDLLPNYESVTSATLSLFPARQKIIIIYEISTVFIDKWKCLFKNRAEIQIEM